jgi:hypothetical protein
MYRYNLHRAQEAAEDAGEQHILEAKLEEAFLQLRASKGTPLSALQYPTVPYSTLQYPTVPYSTLQYLCSTLQYPYTLQCLCSTLQYPKVPLQYRCGYLQRFSGRATALSAAL